MSRGAKGMLVTCGGLVLILIGVLVLAVTGHKTGAFMLGNFGTLFWMLGVLLYLAVFDSKRRWPELGFSDRLVNMLTFKR